MMLPLAGAATAARAAALPPDCRTAIRLTSSIAARPAVSTIEGSDLERLEEAKGDFQQCGTQSTESRIMGLGFTGALYVDTLVATSDELQAAQAVRSSARDDERTDVAKNVAIAAYVLVDTESDIDTELPLTRDDLRWMRGIHTLAGRRLASLYALKPSNAKRRIAEFERETWRSLRPPEWPAGR